MFWTLSIPNPKNPMFALSRAGTEGFGGQAAERHKKCSTCSDWEKRKHECCSEFCHEQIDGALQNRGNYFERNLPSLTLSSPPGRVCNSSSHSAFWSALFILSPIVMGQFSFHAITCCSTNYIFALKLESPAESDWVVPYLEWEVVTFVCCCCWLDLCQSHTANWILYISHITLANLDPK